MQIPETSKKRIEKIKFRKQKEINVQKIKTMKNANRFLETNGQKFSKKHINTNV